MNVLIISAHPDDEILGCGGAIVKHHEKGDNIFVCIVSEGVTAQYSKKSMITTRREHAKRAGDIVGVKEYFFYDLPDAKLDTIPQLEINKIIEQVVQKIKPEIVYVHHGEDINSDHFKVYQSAMVACRPPKAHFIKKILLYEVFGSTLHFNPNIYYDITNVIAKKLEAMSMYKTEIVSQTRTLETINKLSAFRGAEIGVQFAEAFILCREII